MEHAKRKVYIHVAVIVFFMFFFQFLPQIGTITPLGMRILGIFFGVIYGWSTMDFIWPSLLGLFSLSLLPNTGAVEVFKSGFGDRVTVAIFLFLILGGLINKVGLSKYIAEWCVSRKFVQNKPYGILIMFCLAGGFISAFVNVFASMIIMLGIFYSFCQEANLKPGDAFAKVTLIAILYTGCMAGDLFPFMGLGLILDGIQEKMTGVEINYVVFTLLQIMMIVLASLVYLLIIKYVVKPDTSFAENYSKKSESLKMTSEQKFVFTLLIFLLVFLFLPGLLPKDFALTSLLSALDLSGMLALVLVIYFVFELKNKKAISFPQMAEDINWGLVLMFATVAPLTTAISSNEAGIMQYISNTLTHFLSNMSPFAFVIMIIFLASILTQFCNNVAVVLVTVPLMYNFSTQLGIDPNVITILVAFNLNVAFCTPAASASAAMMFNTKKWIDSKTAFTHGLIIFVINMVVTIICAYILNI